jgi:hypothetical protein
MKENLLNKKEFLVFMKILYQRSLYDMFMKVVFL